MARRKVKRLPRSLTLFPVLVSFLTLLSIGRDLVGLWHRHGRAADFDSLFPPLAGVDLYMFLERMRSVHHAAFFAPTLISLWYLDPNLTYSVEQTAKAVRLFTTRYGLSTAPGQGIYDHSAFELLKVVGRATDADAVRW